VTPTTPPQTEANLLDRLREDVRGSVRPGAEAARGAQAGEDAPREPYKVLLIMTDQQRADTLSAAGNRVIQTPHLDWLAREGTRCARAYVQNPICMPSRATLFTGRYPRSHRVWTNGVPLPAEEVTLAHILSAAGYRTAAFGKLHFTPTGGPPGPGRYESNQMWRDPARAAELAGWRGPYYGLEHVELAIGHNAPGGHYGAWLRREHPDALPLFKPEASRHPRSGAHGSWKSALPAELHASTWVADRTIAYLREQAANRAAGSTGPFFAVCSFPDPHHPFAPPEPWSKMYDPAAMPLPAQRAGELDDLPPHFAAHARGAWHRTGPKPPEYPEGLPATHLREIVAHYYGMISLADHHIGRVLAALDDLGFAQDTLVLFTSDHGELLGDHGLLLKGPFLYEGLARVPMLWRLPGRIAAGAVLDAPVGHVDVVPTVLDLLGIATPLGVQGQSLVPALAPGAADTSSLRPWVLTEYHTGFWPDLSLKQISTGRYKLTHYGHDAFGELFDLQEDPHELHNRFADAAYSAIRRDLERQLLDALFATEDTLPPQIAFA
jgi:arylsulfatase A-like enzyme